MAIKGKGRTRGRRVIAAPPRPTLVVRKPPIWRRPWVWSIIGGLALAGVLAGVLATVHNSQRRDFRQRQIAALDGVSRAFLKRFPVDSQLIPPDLPNFYPTLPTDLSNLAAGKLKSSDAEAEGNHVSSTAQAAADAIDKMNLTKSIPRSFDVTSDAKVRAGGATLHELEDAQSLISHGFRLYAETGNLMKDAATATGSLQKTLADEATTLLSQASSLFDQGYRKLLDIRAVLGLKAPTPVTGAQPGQPLPTIGSSASPTPSASASP